jgi:nitrate reductase molybdenum cofactor assembly chaperone NarJ/NarW
VTPAVDAWDRLADLIEYPDEPRYANRVEACIHATAAFDVGAPLERFRQTITAGNLASWQERYVEAFDFDPACTLSVGWHLLRDAPERGVFLAELREALARAGVNERGELPDHLPTLLRLIGREDKAAASELATHIAPAVARVRDRLTECGSPFGDVMDAAARMLAGLHSREVQP